MKAINFHENYLLLKFKLNPGNAEIYAELYDLFVDKIYRFVFFKVNNQEEAQDLTSDVFLRVWQYVQEKKKVGNFKALLYQVAKNIVIDHYRKKSHSDVLTDEEILRDIEDARGEDFVKEIEIKSEIKSLESFLKQLKAEYQEVLLLKYVEGYSNSEIAKILDKSTGSVRVLSHRALKILQNLISESDRNNPKYD
ncbi:MAG TPA: RNA polymerase sigma factor [bacterium]|nr:RNA polymerase sigma factor [bacterium]